MRLLEVRLAREGARVALVGRVEPARGPITEIYFRFPAELAPAGDPSADPFLPTLLVPSIVAGEPLFLDPPVSAPLLRRATRVQDILTTWYPMRRRIAVAAPARPVPTGGPPFRGGAVGAFFSAGVDSCYTLLKSRLGWPSPADPVTHLIFVKGFDAPLSDAAGLAASEARIRALATRYDCEPIVVETNLRDVLAAPWGELYHGSALAAVGLALGAALETVLIPASYDYGELHPHGSHPLLDELWSSDTTQILHDGCEASRVAKMAALVRHAPSLVDQLRVCWENSQGSPENCGRCGKCVRTMVALRAVGHLGTTRSFPARLPAGYARTFGPDRRRFLQQTLDQARLTGDPALVRALSRRARALDRRLGLNLALRALPLGETLLDVRATLTRRWRGWRGPWGRR